MIILVLDLVEDAQDVGGAGLILQEGADQDLNASQDAQDQDALAQDAQDQDAQAQDALAQGVDQDPDDVRDQDALALDIANQEVVQDHLLMPIMMNVTRIIRL